MRELMSIDHIARMYGSTQAASNESTSIEAGQVASELEQYGTYRETGFETGRAELALSCLTSDHKELKNLF